MLLRVEKNSTAYNTTIRLSGRLVASNRLPGTNGGGIKQLSVVRVSKLTVMAAHMLTGKAVSLPPTTKVVSGQAVRSGNSKTLHLVTHFRRRLTILWASQS
jgi:hypothetical protein